MTNKSRLPISTAFQASYFCSQNDPGPKPDYERLRA